MRSTVLGGEVVTEAGAQGDLATRYVLAGGEKLAQLHFAWHNSVKVDAAQFHHLDPMRVSQRVTRNSPETLLGTDPYNPTYIDPRHTEFDPKGQNVGTVTSYVQQPGGPSEPPIPIEGQSPLYIDGQRANVTLNGLPMSAQEFAAYVNTVGVGGMMGLTQTLMTQFDLRFKNVQLRSTYDASRWHNFGGDMAGAISRAGEFAGPMTIRASLNLGFNASVITSFYAQGWRRLKKGELDAIKPRLAAALDRSPNGVKCRDFLNDVLKRLESKYKDVMSVFDDYAAKLAVYSKPGATGRAPFPAGSRRARLEIDSDSPDLILTILHELLHGSGTISSFDHIPIGREAYESAVAFGLLPAGRDFYEGDPEKLNSKDWRVKWHEEGKVENGYFEALKDALKAACGETNGGKPK